MKVDFINKNKSTSKIELKPTSSLSSNYLIDGERENKAVKLDLNSLEFCLSSTTCATCVTNTSNISFLELDDSIKYDLYLGDMDNPKYMSLTPRQIADLFQNNKYLKCIYFERAPFTCTSDNVNTIIYTNFICNYNEKTYYPEVYIDGVKETYNYDDFTNNGILNLNNDIYYTGYSPGNAMFSKNTNSSVVELKFNFSDTQLTDQQINDLLVKEVMYGSLSGNSGFYTIYGSSIYFCIKGRPQV